MTRLLLLRHGRTAWNAEGRAQGQADVELDDTGHAQAAAVAPVLASLRPVRLWSSDLARARQTAAYVAKECDLDAELDPRLREYDVGERSGLTLAEFADAFPTEHAAWTAGEQVPAVAGAETHQDVRDRVVPALSAAWSTLGDGETGVAVLHGACLRTGLFAWLGWPEEAHRTVGGLDNCGWAELRPGPEGAARLAAWNRTAPHPIS